MLLKFNRDAWYQGKLVYKQGEIVEVSEEQGYASRWIRRGAAQAWTVEAPEIVEEPKSSKKKVSKKKATKKIEIDIVEPEIEEQLELL